LNRLLQEATNRGYSASWTTTQPANLDFPCTHTMQLSSWNQRLWTSRT
jgi:hypothetical protein